METDYSPTRAGYTPECRAGMLVKLNCPGCHLKLSPTYQIVSKTDENGIPLEPEPNQIAHYDGCLSHLD